VILFRCDICQKEVTLFWNIAITRKRIHSQNPHGIQPVLEKSHAFDVCSEKCEQAAVAKILSVIVPIAKEVTS